MNGMIKISDGICGYYAAERLLMPPFNAHGNMTILCFVNENMIRLLQNPGCRCSAEVRRRWGFCKSFVC